MLANNLLESLGLGAQVGLVQRAIRARSLQAPALITRAIFPPPDPKAVRGPREARGHLGGADPLSG